MGWEQDGIRWWYDTTPRRRLRIRLTRDERRRTARVKAMLAGLPRWMAEIEAAVSP